MMAISCRNLNKRYGQRQVLRDIDLAVNTGEVYCLLGPNGAGKTTLLSIVCGQIHPSSGSLSVMGCDPVAEPRRLLGRLGIASSNARGLWWRLTGRENLMRSAALYRVPARKARSRIHELLDRFGLVDAGNRIVGLYSTGMRMRLALARALLHEPALLVLDEPWSGLDPRAKIDLSSTLAELAREGRAVLVTSHELPQVEQSADRVGIIVGGAMVAEGTPAELVKLLPFVYSIRIEDERSAAMEQYQCGSADEALEVLGRSLSRGATDIEVRRGRIEDVYFERTSDGDNTKEGVAP